MRLREDIQIIYQRSVDVRVVVEAMKTCMLQYVQGAALDFVLCAVLRALHQAPRGRPTHPLLVLDSSPQFTV
eukprot:13521050-Heterocapsa_arctica.AAC.1